MAKLAVSAIAGMMLLYAGALAQPPGYQSEDAAGAGDMKICLAWGDHFRPAGLGMTALTNLRRAAAQAGMNVSAETQSKISSTDLSAFAVVFVIADEPVQLSDTEKRKLRDYIDKGGLIVLDNADAASPGSPAYASFLQFVADVTGSKRMQNLSNDHEIFRKPNNLGGPPIGSDTEMSKVGITVNADGTTRDNKVMAERPLALQGVTKSGRLAILVSSKGYCNNWNDVSDSPQMKFGVNLIAYGIASRKR